MYQAQEHKLHARTLRIAIHKTARHSHPCKTNSQYPKDFSEFLKLIDRTNPLLYFLRYYVF